MAYKQTSEEKDSPKKGLLSLLLSSRMALAFVGFLGFVNLYAQRVNLSVAIVCMINQTAVQRAKSFANSNGSSSSLELSTNDHLASHLLNGSFAEAGSTGGLPGSPVVQLCAGSIDSTLNATMKQSKEGEFEWDKETQGIVLGAFFWGYLLTQIPGGWLAQRFGGKRVFGYSMLMAAVATLLSPAGARFSPIVLIALRIVNGMGQGVAFPAMHVIWTKWAPPLERSKLIGFTYAGAQIGNVLTMPVSAMLCDYGFDGGWGSIFYVFGTVGVAWFALWMFVVSDTPAQHPRISAEERAYIETSLRSSSQAHPDAPSGTPWLKFAKSLPVWAIVVAHTTSNWGTYTLLTNIPTYMKEILKFDIKSNGLLSAVPFVVFWAIINASGYVADYLRTRGWRTKVVRKIMLSFGSILPAIMLVATGYVSCQTPYVALAVLSLAVGFSGFQYPSVMVNHVDIAPPFAGVLFGISNTVATLSGVFSPYTIGRITKDGTQAEWQIVFYIAACIYCVGAVFFFIFADGELQTWVKPYLMTAESTELREIKPHPVNDESEASPAAAAASEESEASQEAANSTASASDENDALMNGSAIELGSGDAAKDSAL